MKNSLFCSPDSLQIKIYIYTSTYSYSSWIRREAQLWLFLVPSVFIVTFTLQKAVFCYLIASEHAILCTRKTFISVLYRYKTRLSDESKLLLCHTVFINHTFFLPHGRCRMSLLIITKAFMRQNVLF